MLNFDQKSEIFFSVRKRIKEYSNKNKKTNLG